MFSLKDPNVGFVTITDVSVSTDHSYATVYCSFLGQDPRNEAGLKPVEAKTEKDVVCRKCGSVMRKTGDNVYVCDGAAKDKDGNVIKNKDGSDKRCGYFYIRHKKTA